MKKKKFWIYLCAMLCCICISIFNIARITGAKPAQATSTASWSTVYESTNDMISDADLVIKGRLVEEIPELRKDMVFTHEMVEVTDVYKGDTTVGTVLDILQTGGDLDGVSTPSIDVAPLFTEVASPAELKDTEFVLCLKQTEYDELYGQYYLICGGFQGAGIVEDNLYTTKITGLTDETGVLIDECTLNEIEVASDACEKATDKE